MSQSLTEEGLGTQNTDSHKTIKVWQSVADPEWVQGVRSNPLLAPPPPRF